MLWKHRLQYKFQNRRKRGDTTIEAVQRKKLKTARKPATPPPSVVQPPTYWGMKNYLPNRPASEDDQTIAKNIAWLQAERRKKQPDFKTVSCLMDKTLADRRKWIASSKPQPTTEEVQARYPWLFDEDQVRPAARECLASPPFSLFKVPKNPSITTISWKGPTSLRSECIQDIRWFYIATFIPNPSWVSSVGTSGSCGGWLGLRLGHLPGKGRVTGCG